MSKNTCKGFIVNNCLFGKKNSDLLSIQAKDQKNMSSSLNKRCAWLDLSKADYIKYHDEEWGVPIYDDRTLFEYLCLESAQAGLSWYTILKRRNGYRQAFANFDVEKIAQFTQSTIEDLMNNQAIIRHRGKIAAVINNAQKCIAIQQEFGSFSHYVWGFVNHQPMLIDEYQHQQSSCKDSEQLSKDLKRRGFSFVGPTICYAYMQACGMINGHDIDCFRRNQIKVVTSQ